MAHLSFAAALLLNAGEKIMKMQFDEQNEALPYILFRIKDNFFTISCECISDMQPAPKTVTHLPKAPEFVCGTFQSFGRVITLFDLTMLLGFCNVPEEIPNKTVIILKSSPFKVILWMRFYLSFPQIRLLLLTFILSITDLSTVLLALGLSIDFFGAQCG